MRKIIKLIGIMTLTAAATGCATVAQPTQSTIDCDPTVLNKAGTKTLPEQCVGSDLVWIGDEALGFWTYKHLKARKTAEYEAYLLLRRAMQNRHQAAN